MFGTILEVEFYALYLQNKTFEDITSLWEKKLLQIIIFSSSVSIFVDTTTLHLVYPGVCIKSTHLNHLVQRLHSLEIQVYISRVYDST